MNSRHYTNRYPNVPPAAYPRSMTLRTLGTAAVAATLLTTLGAGVAEARPSKPAHCKILSTSVQTQTRDVAGMIMSVSYVNGHPVYTYGHGVQHRTATTMTERCRGKVSKAVTYTAWTY